MADEVFRENYERRMEFLDRVEEHGLMGVGFKEAMEDPLPCGCVPYLTRAKFNVSMGAPVEPEKQAGAEFVCKHGWRVRVLVLRDRVTPEP